MYGLSLELFIGVPKTEPSQNIFYDEKTSGIRLILHNQTVSPISSEALSLKPGTCTNIEMVKTYIEHLPYPYSKLMRIFLNFCFSMKKSLSCFNL
jgi:hypothetical protein